MLLEPDFDDVVLFDVPAEYADSLTAHLNPDRVTWLHRSEKEELFVVAALRAEPDDLAGLLRDVEIWFADSDLPYLRFILDGRAYMLPPDPMAPAGKAP
jgi:hypothetical protein